MKKIIVLAGNFKQFRNYILDNLEFPPEKYLYGESPEKMFGIEAERIDIVGTFWHRKDAEKLKEIAESIKIIY